MELLNGRKLSLKVKGRNYRELCNIGDVVRERHMVSAGKVEMTILKTTKKALIRPMCVVKLIEKKE